MSIPTGERYPAFSLSPQKRKDKILAALTAQVEGREPVLMIYEDLQWSDPTTRESLDLLIQHVPRLRLLLLITFRPEFSPQWVGGPAGDACYPQPPASAATRGDDRPCDWR
jgi:predicted ATPase